MSRTLAYTWMWLEIIQQIPEGFIMTACYAGTPASRNSSFIIFRIPLLAPHVLFWIFTCFCAISAQAATNLTVYQEKQLDQILSDKQLELVTSEKEALANILEAIFQETNQIEITEDLLNTLEANIQPNFRMPADDARITLERIAESTELTESHKRFFAHLVLLPHMIDANVCHMTDKGFRRCAFAFVRGDVDIKAQLIAKEQNPVPIPGVPEGSSLATVLSLNEGFDQIAALIGVDQDQMCSRANNKNETALARGHTPSLDSVSQLLLKAAMSAVRFIVPHAIAQEAPDAFIADYYCVEAGEVAFVSVHDDYWSLGSGYSAWGELTGAYYGNYLATNADSIGVVLPLAAECGWSCLYTAFFECGGLGTLVNDQMRKAFGIETPDEEWEEVIVCASRKIELKSRHLRAHGVLQHYLSGEECNTIPTHVESSPMFQTVRDKRQGYTAYGKTFYFELNTHAQRPYTTPETPVTGGNMYPLPTKATVDLLGGEYGWLYDFWEVRSWEFNIVYAASHSLNTNRTCRSKFTHRPRNISAWGDAAWGWYGAYSGSDKWELPEVSWIAAYQAGHPPIACDVDVDPNSLPTTEDILALIPSTEVNEATDDSYDDVVVPAVGTGISLAPNAMFAPSVSSDDSYRVYWGTVTAPPPGSTCPTCTFTHIGYEVWAGYQPDWTKMARVYSTYNTSPGSLLMRNRPSGMNFTQVMSVWREKPLTWLARTSRYEMAGPVATEVKR